MNKNIQTKIKRGFMNKCPQCGEGKILRFYITPYKNCSECGLDYTPLRADDGPAWATILISGHLAMPFVFWILEQGLNNTALEITLSILVITVLSIIILPRAKSVFMSIIWFMHFKKEQEKAPNE